MYSVHPSYDRVLSTYRRGMGLDQVKV